MSEVKLVEPKKLLLVDDAKTMLMMVELILEGQEYVFVKAHDGEEAIATARRERPDLILMDVVMPRKDGFEACKELRESPETKETPIILVTTRGEEEHVEMGYMVGCSDYVTKPFRSIDLLAKVKAYLEE